MYLDKPLAGHNLMPVIARVNRVCGEKPGGLIVDLIGVADPLADALATYANATGARDKPIKELQDEAIPAMRSAFEQLRGFFHGYDYSAAFDAEPVNVLRVYLGAVDHVLDTVGIGPGGPASQGAEVARDVWVSAGLVRGCHPACAHAGDAFEGGGFMIQPRRDGDPFRRRAVVRRRGSHPYEAAHERPHRHDDLLSESQIHDRTTNRTPSRRLVLAARDGRSGVAG